MEAGVGCLLCARVGILEGCVLLAGLLTVWSDEARSDQCQYGGGKFGSSLVVDLLARTC